MSSDPAIRISGLSKSYQIAHNDTQRATNLGEAITNRLRNPFKRTEKETFWALKDIDLEINRGEVVGVIGRNGAGKSTLLKVLSRITEPTTGRIELFGRVGSLLEVGTGFHPELTGRENIFLNGAILGMKRSEIRRQFDEIIDFAGVEKFLDTPVKRYSSGMYVRLAFAVAAHLNPEILIIDEVLAVGDAEFQKKCLGKMQDVAQSGRTVIFVSHNMGAIESLCSTGFVLGNGTIVYRGCSTEVISRYNETASQVASTELDSRNDRQGAGATRLCRITITDSEGRPGNYMSIGQEAMLHFHLSQPSESVSCSFTIYSSRGLPITHCSTDNSTPGEVPDFRGITDCITWRTMACQLAPGTYSVNVAIYLNGQLQDRVEDAIWFDVLPGIYNNRAYPMSNPYNSVALEYKWSGSLGKESYQ